MDLDEFIWRSKKRLNDVSEECGCSCTSICKYKQKEITPPLLTCLKIMEISDGKISIEEFLSLEDSKNYSEWISIRKSEKKQ